MKRINVKDIISKLPEASQKKIKRIAQPSWVSPMLATLTHTYFSNKNYIYEHKWDGERIIAYKKGKNVSLMTRNKKIANSSYPHLVTALEQINFNFIIDGEVIASEEGKSSFSLLQLRMHIEASRSKAKEATIQYNIFDLIYIDQYDITSLELLDRKFILSNAFHFKDPLFLTKYIQDNGLKYFQYACKEGWEGLIVKESHSKYEAGIRSKNWLKFKCSEEQEFVIGGFTRPRGQRLDFGALLLGYYQNGELMYAGKVGTGFSYATLEYVGKKLEKLVIPKSPFKSVDISTRDIFWVKPKLVAEIKFSEWTKDNKLRHARFLGLRDDKDAKEVTKEKDVKVKS